jgi:hypothetical protein
MSFSMDPDGRHTRRFDCPCCGDPIDRSWNLIRRDGDVLALYYASCYPHGGAREAWLDVVFGSSHSEGAPDHVTFGCRVGPVAGQAGPVATAVDGGLARDGEALFGRKLSRAEALTHPRLEQFWRVVDFVLAADPLVHRHVYGRPVAVATQRAAVPAVPTRVRAVTAAG